MASLINKPPPASSSPRIEPSQPRVQAPPPPKPAAPVRRAFGNEFSSGKGSALRARALDTTGASTLRSEVRGDGRANCLERAAAISKPGDSVMLLIDGDGVGHAVVVKPNGQVIDPNVPNQPYSSLAAYLAVNPRYQPGPRVSDRVLEQLLSIPPGPQRDLFIQAAGLSKAASLKVADGGTVAPTIGTEAAGELPDPSTWPVVTTVNMADPDEDANCRATPEAGGTRTGGFDDEAPLTVIGQSPPPPAAAEWYQVEGTGTDDQPLTGWVSATVVRDPALQIDPRITERMIELGYVQPDGAVGATDYSNFQLMNGLPVTGLCDEATLAAMWSAEAKISTFVSQFRTEDYNALKETAGGDESCGPASVAMNLAALGLTTIDNADPQTNVQSSRDASGQAEGTTNTDQLVAAAEAGGATTTELAGMDDLDAALARGEPVVLYGLPNQEGTWSRAEGEEYDTDNFGLIHEGGYHWISVIGTTPDGGYLIQDPLSRNGVITVTREELETYADFTRDNGDPSSFSMSLPPPEPEPVETTPTATGSRAH